MGFGRAEVEQAFRRWWTVGAVEERWDAWADLFTEDVTYVEHVYGVMRGRETVRRWIVDLMASNAHIHAVPDYFMIDGARVMLRMVNRYYNPDPAGAPFDFPGVTILEYAGDGLWCYEEDYWPLAAGKSAWKQFEAARKLHGDGALTETPARRQARLSW